MSPTALRPATLEDAAAIARLSAELGYTTDAATMRQRLDRIVPNPHQCVRVACNADGEMLGWIAAERRLLLESGDQAEIVGLVVTAQARQQGIGRLLVQQAEQWAQDQGLAVLRVRSNITRQESHLFYQKLGYAMQKTQHVYGKALPQA